MGSGAGRRGRRRGRTAAAVHNIVREVRVIQLAWHQPQRSKPQTSGEKEQYLLPVDFVGRNGGGGVSRAAGSAIKCLLRDPSSWVDAWMSLVGDVVFYNQSLSQARGLRMVPLKAPSARVREGTYR